MKFSIIPENQKLVKLKWICKTYKILKMRDLWNMKTRGLWNFWKSEAFGEINSAVFQERKSTGGQTSSSDDPAHYHKFKQYNRSIDDVLLGPLRHAPSKSLIRGGRHTKLFFSASLSGLVLPHALSHSLIVWYLSDVLILSLSSPIISFLEHFLENIFSLKWRKIFLLIFQTREKLFLSNFGQRNLYWFFRLKKIYFNDF